MSSFGQRTFCGSNPQMVGSGVTPPGSEPWNGGNDPFQPPPYGPAGSGHNGLRVFFWQMKLRVGCWPFGGASSNHHEGSFYGWFRLDQFTLPSTSYHILPSNPWTSYRWNDMVCNTLLLGSSGVPRIQFVHGANPQSLQVTSTSGPTTFTAFALSGNDLLPPPGEYRVWQNGIANGSPTPWLNPFYGGTVLIERHP